MSDDAALQDALPATFPADTSFVPRLDARQRAMLAEMGVTVWAPEPVAAAAPTAAPSPVVKVASAALPTVSPRLAARASTHAPTEALARPSVAARPALGTALGPRPSGIASMDWPTLQATVAGCEACGLCRNRKHTVFGTGHTQADWMVVGGEAPDQNEDLQGEPFVGQSGQLLDNMLRAVGRSRTGEGAQGAYIANALKCRPPANRSPLPAEVAQCEPYLARQVALVQPKVILALGRFAVQALLQTSEPLGKLRGRVHRYQDVPVIVSYHPAYLLRTPADKAKAWADLCLALQTTRGL